ncbi:MAG TPA: VOC family protein [Acidimicrobiales bacterium]|nr:VOC family protein [Acidimicrobiales bacterium]
MADGGTEADPPQIAQVALCAADLARAVRRYIEGFGFADAGGRVLWGQRAARTQAIGEDTTGCMWWLVGHQDYMQLELFHHTDPPQGRQREGWQPNDHGWVRWGVAVPDFDRAMAALATEGVRTITDPVVVDGRRRVCFTDPDFAIVVEVMEADPPGDAGAAGAAGAGGGKALPGVTYAALSVPDLEAARAFFGGALELEEVAGLHEPSMERLWGLDGADREMVTFRGGDVLLEVVEYRDPPGRRIAEDRLLSDQGFMNIAIGYRTRPALERALDRATAQGWTMNVPLFDRPVAATYLSGPDGVSLEMLSMPRELYEPYGFVARPALPPEVPMPTAGRPS